MKKLLILSILTLLVCWQANAKNAVDLNVGIKKTHQGQALAVWSNQLANTDDLSIEFLGRTFPVAISPNKSALCLAACDISTRPGVYQVKLRQGTAEIAQTQVTVVGSNYGVRTIDGVDARFIPKGGGKAIPPAYYGKNAGSYAALKPAFLNWQMPVATPSNSYFGRQSTVNGHKGTPHAGIDLKGNIGDPVKAAADAKVLSAGDAGAGGMTILLDHGSGIISGYRHLSKINVASGQEVKKGQLIGLIGTTGRSTGPHLHFDVRICGIAVDPVSVFTHIGFLRSKWR